MENLSLKPRKVKVLIVDANPAKALELETMLQDKWVIAHSMAGTEMFLIVLVKG